MSKPKNPYLTEDTVELYSSVGEDRHTVLPEEQTVTTELEESYKISRWSLCAVHFILAADFFIINPTLYLYLHNEFDKDKAFQGYVLGAFFGAQTIFAPIFGWAADNFSIRWVFTLAVSVCAVGNLMYALGRNVWLLFAGRVIAGAAAAVDATTYGYIAQVVRKSELTSSMATLRLFFGAGQILAPALSLLISVSNVDISTGSVRIDVYTLPSFITAFLCLGYVAIVWCTLKELPRILIQARKSKEKAAKAAETHTRKEMLIAISLLFTLFTLVFLMGAVNAFNVPMTKQYFGWGTTENSLMLTASGAVSMLTVLAIKGLANRVRIDERWAMLVSHSLVIASLALLVIYDDGKIQVWRYVLGFVLTNLGFASAATYMYGIYAKLHAKSSSTFMSWLPSAGAFARVLGPIFGGVATVPDNEGDPNYGILGGGGLAAIGLIVFILTLPHLPSGVFVPPKTVRQFKVNEPATIQGLLSDHDGRDEDETQFSIGSSAGRTSTYRATLVTTNSGEPGDNNARDETQF